MQVIERFVKAKTGRRPDCEDRVVCSRHFAGVVDGATSIRKAEQEKLTGGQLAARVICTAVRQLNPDVDAAGAIEALTQALARLFRANNLLQRYEKRPHLRPSASVVLYSARRREVWFVGDCQCLMIDENGRTETLTNPKRVDAVTSDARSLFLQAEIYSQGTSIDMLRAHDPGRKYIETLLKRQRVFQNAHPESEYSYAAIDGFPVLREGIKVIQVPATVRQLVLASDGYPKLFASLKETESFLKQTIRTDALLVRGEFKSTKGVRTDQVSFDDRAFLKLQL